MSKQITLYTSKICPYAQRVEMALIEAKAEHTKHWIDLQNKPEWYSAQVNPAGKVPAITYGGPPVPPEQPSPDSIKLAESLILVEFVADIHPSSTILPKDPVQRAVARFFIDTVSTKVLPVLFDVYARKQPIDNLFKAIDILQTLLPAEGKGKYALGDIFTIADIAAAPFLGRLMMRLDNNLGVFEDGEKLQVLQNDPRYEKFMNYATELRARESFKATFDEEHLKEFFAKRAAALRAQKPTLLNECL